MSEGWGLLALRWLRWPPMAARCLKDISIFVDLGCFIMFLTSIHQTTNLFSPFFSTNFSQFEQLKKITTFLLVQNRYFLSFGPMKSLFSFSTAQLKKLRKTRFVVWWFDVTNWLFKFLMTVQPKFKTSGKLQTQTFSIIGWKMTRRLEYVSVAWSYYGSMMLGSTHAEKINKKMKCLSTCAINSM